MSVICGQELHCFLYDCVLVDPRSDGWESFQNAITVWVDCWFSGAIVGFTMTGGDLSVWLPNGHRLATLWWRPDSEYTLIIDLWDPDTHECTTDAYSYVLPMKGQ